MPPRRKRGTKPASNPPSPTPPPTTICVSSFLSPSSTATLTAAFTTMPSASASASASAAAAAMRRPSLASSITSTATTKPSTAERNIDNVVLGDIVFRAWYPSYHVKEIVGKEVVDGKTQMLERLYVCNHCFKYSKELMAWVGHVKNCERGVGGMLDQVPGNQIYTHENGTWSVWEVDGEVDTLYCQNLSLFAKLFLDNKSVFFDVTGFNYFLLVHTDLQSGAQHVVGFFSKEKISWDANNLACILVFPPWQRKGLGALLIAVSYEISRRERLLGGPEKPISDLGRRGYVRFWSAEIARYLLDVRESDRKKGRGAVSLDQMSRDTWICAEDCLGALRDMGVAVAAGKGKGDVLRVRIDKERVREWARAAGVGLEPIIDPRGFPEHYGYKPAAEEEVGE